MRIRIKKLESVRLGNAGDLSSLLTVFWALWTLRVSAAFLRARLPGSGGQGVVGVVTLLLGQLCSVLCTFLPSCDIDGKWKIKWFASWMC